jgi:hypothetical protein
MNITVSLKKSWGKELFYPESPDAKFITALTGHPTISKRQIKICLDAGFKVTLVQDQLDLEDYLRFMYE